MNVRPDHPWVIRGLGALTGLLLMFPHLWSRAAPLQAVGLLPLLLVVRRPGGSLRMAATAGLYAGLAYALPQVIALGMHPAIVLILTLEIALVMTVFGAAAWWLLRRPGLLRRRPGEPGLAGAFGVGSALAVLDWINFSIFPVWGTAQSLARPWSRYPELIRFTSLTGITGVVFIVGAVQALAVQAIFGPRRGRWVAAVAVVLLAAAAGDLCTRPGRPSGVLRVAAIGWAQADMYQHDPDQDPGFDALYAAPLAMASAQGAKLIVSPEMGFSMGRADRQERLARFGELARRHRVFLCVGYADYSAMENRLFFMGPGGELLAEYVKTNLAPFEKFRPGRGEPVSVEVGPARVGGIICQDDNFAALTRAHGRLGASVLAIPTCDWSSVKEAHFQNTVHRAIESRFAVVRAALDGISAIVAPGGEVLAHRDHLADGPGVLVADVPLCPAATLFDRAGHWPVAACSVMLVILIVAGLRRRNPQSS